MKERFARLGGELKRVLSLIGDLVILNLLFLVCSVPVVTIGAAASACYAGLFRTLQKKETGIPIRSFFQDFGAAFKQATAGWLLMLLCLIVLAADAWFAVVYSEPNNRFFLIFSIVSTAVLLLAALWFFPLVARFYNPLRAHLKNSFLLAFAQFPRTFLALIVWAIFLGMPVFLFDTFVYFGWFWLLCGFSLPMYLTAGLFRQSLKLQLPADGATEED